MTGSVDSIHRKTPPANNTHGTWHERLSRRLALATGHPTAFIIAVGVIAVWAVTGPIFNFNDTWQLLINTGTTIATFLMVFLIQQAQNRDTMALQAKLAELVIAVQGAENRIALAEDLSEAELMELHDRHAKQAEEQLDRLKEAADRARDKETVPAE
jgi:low affinity Fe/Cu permease